jgi:hypothetical protein
MGYTSRHDAIAKVAARQEFRGNSIWATRSPSGSGIIYGRAQELYTADATAGELVYVVYSYSTPIAWYTKRGEWVVPAEKYSHTTSRHQSVVRQGVGLPRGAVSAIVR